MPQRLKDIVFALFDHHLSAVEGIVLQLVVVFPLESADVYVVLEHYDATEVHICFADHHRHLGLTFD